MHRRGLLLDRDGIINVDDLYVGSRERFQFVPGVIPFLRAVQDKGYRLAILTNQSGVARGFYTVADYQALTAWMLKELAGNGVVIDLVLHCFECADGSVDAYSRESFWRKPNPGMVLDAIQRLNLDPKQSAFLGDRLSDMEAAEAGGIHKRVLLPHQDIKKYPAGIAIAHSYDDVLTILN